MIILKWELFVSLEIALADISDTVYYQHATHVYDVHSILSGY